MPKGELKVTISAVFRCRCDDATKLFLKTFGDMTCWWLQKIEETKPKSQSALRDRHYEEGRKIWRGWNSQHIETSSLLAYNAGSENNLLRLAIVSPNAAGVTDAELRISLKPNVFGHVELDVNSAEKRNLIALARDGLCRLGQITLTEDWVLIPFIVEIGLQNERSGLIEGLFAPKKED